MKTRVNRQTVDLSAYPNLVVIYLGMCVNAWTGIKTVFGLGPQIAKAVADKPDGLLLHEDLFFSLRHVGMRQYWRDFESMEAWTRSLPHRQWWQQFLRDSGGTGFWHEAYFIRGGIEGIYDDVAAPVGPMFSARQRLHLGGEAVQPVPVPEEDVIVSQ